MSVRIRLTIVNNTGADVKCTSIKCEKFLDLTTGTVIANNTESVFLTETNDRIFCEFDQTNNSKAGKWQMGMTCPKSSDNNAYGTFMAGLQKYKKSGTPLELTYILGTKNLADWDHGDKNEGNTRSYGDC